MADDLDADVSAKRDELAKVTREIAVARETADTLLRHAKSIKAQAEQDAAAIVAEATELAQRTLADAGIR